MRVEPEIPEGIPTVHLSPCTIRAAPSVTPCLSLARYVVTQDTSQTHREAVPKAERRRALEKAGNVADEAVDDGIDPLVGISRPGIVTWQLEGQRRRGRR